MNERNSVTVFGGAVLLATQIGGALANIMRKTSLQSVLQKSEQLSMVLDSRLDPLRLNADITLSSGGGAVL